jgi:hypothetical protein
VVEQCNDIYDCRIIFWWAFGQRDFHFAIQAPVTSMDVQEGSVGWLGDLLGLFEIPVAGDCSAAG